jgi:hypothetical protein
MKSGVFYQLTSMKSDFSEAGILSQIYSSVGTKLDIEKQKKSEETLAITVVREERNYSEESALNEIENFFPSNRSLGSKDLLHMGQDKLFRTNYHHFETEKISDCLIDFNAIEEKRSITNDSKVAESLYDFGVSAVSTARSLPAHELESFANENHQITLSTTNTKALLPGAIEEVESKKSFEISLPLPELALKNDVDVNQQISKEIDIDGLTEPNKFEIQSESNQIDQSEKNSKSKPLTKSNIGLTKY